MRATGQATSNKGQRQSTMSMTHKSTMINDRLIELTGDARLEFLPAPGMKMERAGQ